MPFILPDLKSANCLVTTVCASLLTNRQKGPGFSKKSACFIAPFKNGPNDGFLRFEYGGDVKNHLRLDVATKENFADDPLPKTNSTVDEIFSKIEPLNGCETHFMAHARFKVKSAELPSNAIMRTMGVENEIADLSVKLSGATLKIKGAVEELRWSENEDGTFIISVTTGMQKGKISEDYLATPLNHLSIFLNAFAYRKTPNAPAPKTIERRTPGVAILKSKAVIADQSCRYV